MKKIGMLGLLLTGLVMGAYTAQASDKPELPRAGSGQYFADPSFIGMKSSVIYATLAPKQIVSDDKGLLYGICRQDQTAGTYAIAYDYYTALGPLRAYIGIGGGSAEANSNRDTMVSPYVYSSGAVTGYRGPSVWGCWTPKWPVRFESGLVGINEGAGGFSVFYYRLDDGTND